MLGKMIMVMKYRSAWYKVAHIRKYLVNYYTNNTLASNCIFLEWVIKIQTIKLLMCLLSTQTTLGSVIKLLRLTVRPLSSVAHLLMHLWRKLYSNSTSKNWEYSQFSLKTLLKFKGSHYFLTKDWFIYGLGTLGVMRIPQTSPHLTNSSALMGRSLQKLNNLEKFLVVEHFTAALGLQTDFF